jgi:hypothetical protein
MEDCGLKALSPMERFGCLGIVGLPRAIPEDR